MKIYVFISYFVNLGTFIVITTIIAVQCLYLALKFPLTPLGMSNFLNTLGDFQSITLDICHCLNWSNVLK